MKLVRFLLLACICMMACRQQPQSNEVTNYDLPQMKDSGELVVLTLNSSTSYFNYRGEPMGFQYELAEQFARSLGVKLRMETAKNTHDLVHKLLTGEGDLIAYNLPITKEFKDSVEFCGEDIITHQVLVQRNSNKVPPLQNVTELIGKEVYVKPGKYLDRLINLDKELGGGILIHKVENDSVTTEDLIMQVSNGTIDYAVCDNDLAKLNKTYYPNLNICILKSANEYRTVPSCPYRKEKYPTMTNCSKSTPKKLTGTGGCWLRWPTRNRTSIRPPSHGQAPRD